MEYYYHLFIPEMLPSCNTFCFFLIYRELYYSLLECIRVQGAEVLLTIKTEKMLTELHLITVLRIPGSTFLKVFCFEHSSL